MNEFITDYGCHAILALPYILLAVAILCNADAILDDG